MNTKYTKSVSLFLLVIGGTTLFDAARRESTLPLISVLSAENEFIGRNVSISGVLGYAANCEYVIYSNQIDAIQQRDDSGLKLVGLVDSSTKIGSGFSLEKAVGRYVIVSGKLRKSSESTAEVDFYVEKFENVIGNVGSGEKCENGTHNKGWMDIGKIFVIGPERIGSNVTIAGVLGQYYEQGLVIFSDRDAAASGVWSNGVILRIKDDPEGLHAREWTSHMGEYVVVSGMLEKAIGRSGFSFRLVDSEIRSFPK